jgi:diguanylate cyclase (GGDEF)-like protein
MRTSWRDLAIGFLVFSVFVTFTSIIFINFERLRLGNAAILRSGAESLWSTHEIEIELLRLLQAMHRFQAPDPGVDLEALRLRLDILWSRLPPLLEGRDAAQLREASDVETLGARLSAALQEISDILDAPSVDAAAYARAMAGLEAFATPIRELSLVALHQTSQGHAELQRRLDDIYTAILMASCGLGLGTLGLITLLVFQLGRSQKLLDLKERANAQIEHLAHHDVLTGLPNRRLFNDRLAQSLAAAARRSSGVGLHFIDVDNFKAINDTFGHMAGDQVLQEAARRMAATMREVDTLARIAGDEFAAIQIDVATADGVVELSERLIRAFEQPFDVAGNDLQASISIGSTLFPDDGRTTERLLSNADVALHRAKQNGRRQGALFDEVMMEKEARRRRLGVRLEQAREHGELSIRYQPKFATADGRLMGFEALIRWDRSPHVEVSPTEFIPIAESNGSIVPIGDWVLWTACRDLAGSAARHRPDVTLAINLSPVQIQKEDCFRRFLKIVESLDFDPRRLEFEITETSLFNADTSTLANIRDLHDVGARICLDDFGTGYSSLSHLQALPLNSMKLDRGFVARLDDHRTQCICEGITALGHRLGLEIVGEGAETEWQYNELVRMGCDQVQGYYLGRPMPIEELDGFMASLARAPA